ncbi:hypothetical protein D3C87_1510800 [compost metagenome]
MENVHILRFQSFHGIYHQYHYVRFFKGFNGTHNRVKLNIFLNLSLFTQSGCINEHKFMAKLVVMDVDRIAGGTCNRRYNVSFLSNQRIDQGRFSNIWPSNDGNFRQGIFFFRNIFKVFDHFIQ